MKRIATYGLFLTALLIPGYCQCQEKAQKEETKATPSRPEVAQLKVQIVFSEYEGEKKMKSLPYSLLVVAANDLAGNPTTSSKIRIGDRVPVATGMENGTVQFQYIDVGTNIDCRAIAVPDGRFRLAMSLERSWVQATTDLADVSATSSPKGATTAERQFHQPTIRQFRTDSTMILRDGQSIESNFATEPMTGKVIKLEITMTVVK